MRTLLRPHTFPNGEAAQLLERYYAEFQPTTEHESFLVRQMAYSRWRVAQFLDLETGLIAASACTRTPDPRLASIQRSIGAAESSYYKAHSEFKISREPASEPGVEVLSAAPAKLQLATIPETQAVALAAVLEKDRARAYRAKAASSTSAELFLVPPSKSPSKKDLK